ncbi:MAG: hypothetical protein EHM39_05805 [Chloroflexi bacterium]|nr:MAG: hypothetical protein EHM39_05805 [Chloroflexota bacterium]
MSKRNLVLVVMAVLLALTPALAIGLAESHTAQDAGQGQTLALHMRFGDPIAPLREPTCPDPSNPGCGGG